MKALALAALLAAAPLAAGAAERIVSVGGSVTETIAALGALDRVVARDTTSSWPEEVEALPDVGYVRRLSPEGVLSVAPDLILAEEGAGPVARKGEAVGAALGPEARAAALAVRIETRIAETAAPAGAAGHPARVAFALSA